jgi:hypothetical protein
MAKTPDLLEYAKTVLLENDKGRHTIPSSGIYPHQWLWDSCFIAIGQRHYDVDRAKTEILSLLRGQWHNGMLPNIILSETSLLGRKRDFWRSKLNPNAPDDVATSGITQPPMVAEAIVQIGAKLPIAERRGWYKTVYPALLKYHQWLYTERDPHQEGLTIQIHPWETGMDNTPPWMAEIQQHLLPTWIHIIQVLHLEPLITMLRRRSHLVPAEQKIGTVDGLVLYSTQRRLRRKEYDIDRILSHSLFAVEDLAFNSILIRANQHLTEIAKVIKEPLPADLKASMARTEAALEKLWDPYSEQYYSRNFVTHRLLKEPSIATLLPLYAGTISKERAAQLVQPLHNEHLFDTLFPVASVPVNSAYFNPHGYWQGPSWLNLNWLIIKGLERYGFRQEANHIRETSLAMVGEHGSYEYFSPLDGSPAGAHDFSWTAALTIDLIKT